MSSEGGNNTTESLRFVPRPSDDYLAVNGHIMTTVDWRWSERTQEWTRIQWNAQHSEKCPCNGDEELPDW